MARFSGRTRSVLFLASSPLLGLAGWQFWSRRSFFEPFTAQTDPLFQSHYLKKFNPRNNPSEDDCCVRLVPLAKLRAGLVEDALNGGPKLVESFTAGLWGGFGTLSIVPGFLNINPGSDPARYEHSVLARGRL